MWNEHSKHYLQKECINPHSAHSHTKSKARACNQFWSFSTGWYHNGYIYSTNIMEKIHPYYFAAIPGYDIWAGHLANQEKDLERTIDSKSEVSSVQRTGRFTR